jgi:hypothetical protein
MDISRGIERLEIALTGQLQAIKNRLGRQLHNFINQADF